MRRRTPFLLTLGVFLLWTGGYSTAFAEGDLQVICKRPGVRIYVDGKFMGATKAEEEGLFVEGLADGPHKLKAIANGFKSATKQFTIRNGGLTEVPLRFVRKPPVVENPTTVETATLELKTGTLELPYVPARPEATISIDGKVQGKGRLKVKNLAAGPHRIVWQRGDQQLKAEVEVIADETVRLKANFNTGEVVNETEIENRKRAEQERIAAEKRQQQEEARRPTPSSYWRDPVSRLTWQNPPAPDDMNWADAKQYCRELDLGGGGWHLPTIGELRSLIRGCSATESGGSCNVEENDCLAFSCKNKSCIGCLFGKGPASGCFWPEEMEGACSAGDPYWSSSAIRDYDDEAWRVDFYDAHTRNSNVHGVIRVRCVR